MGAKIFFGYPAFFLSGTDARVNFAEQLNHGLGFLKVFFPMAFCMKYLSIFSVTV